MCGREFVRMIRKWRFSGVIGGILSPKSVNISSLYRYNRSISSYSSITPLSKALGSVTNRFLSSRMGIPVHTTQAVETAMKILSDKKILRKRDIDDHFSTYAESMNMTQLINFFYFCTKKSMVLDSNQLKIFSSELYSRRGSFDSAQFGKMLYSLKLYSGKSAAERELILVIHSKIDEAYTILTSQTIANMLYGLNKMNSHREEIQTLLSSMASHIARSQCILNGQEIASALYGLQGMHSSHEAVRDILRVLSRKIEFSPSEFTSQIISNSLYGLQEMKADNKEVQFLLRVLKYKIDQSHESLTPLAISNTLYGLKSMTSDIPEVRRLLPSLARLIGRRDENLNEGTEIMKWNEEPLTSHGIACSLYGLQGMSSDENEVRVLLTALAQRMNQTADLMSSQHIGMSLHGFKNMSSQYPEVRALVKLVADIIGRSEKPIDTHGIALGLYGIRGLSSEHAETLELLHALTPRIKVSEEPFLAITVANTLVSFQSLNIYDSPVVLEFMRSVFTHVKKCNERFKPGTICKVLQTLKFCHVTPRSSDIDGIYLAECDRFLSTVLSDISLKLQSAMKVSPPQIFPVEALGDAFSALLTLPSERMEGKFLKQLLFSNVKRCSERKEKFPLTTSLDLLRSYDDLKIDTTETRQGLKVILMQISWWAKQLSSETNEMNLGSDVDVLDDEAPSTDDMKHFLKNPNKYEVITLSNNSNSPMKSSPPISSATPSVEETLPSPLSKIEYSKLLEAFKIIESLPQEFQSNLTHDLVVILDGYQSFLLEQEEAKEEAKRLEEAKKRMSNRPVRRRTNPKDDSAQMARDLDKISPTLMRNEEEKREMQEILRSVKERYEGHELQSRIDRLIERLG